MRGAAIAWAPAPTVREPAAWSYSTWETSLPSRIAPTARDEESRGDPSKNPDLDHLLRARCRTRRRAAWVEWPGTPVCSRPRAMSAPMRRPCLIGGWPPEHVSAEASHIAVDDDSCCSPDMHLNKSKRRRCFPRSHRNKDSRKSAACSELSGDQRTDLRGFGWDIDSALSQPRGMIFPIGSFGHRALPEPRFGWIQAQIPT